MTDALVVLIDDLRSFNNDRPARVARNSRDGLALLQSLHGTEIDELWLDHDLGLVEGEIDEIKPVVKELEEKAVWDQPYAIGTIFVHTSNSYEAEGMTKGLRLRGYNARRVNAGDHLHQ